MPRGAAPNVNANMKSLSVILKNRVRYGNRAPEVAARIVNKQRAQYGETKGEKKEEREGHNPDRDLPLDHYRHLTIAQLKARLQGLSKRDLNQVRRYEEKHKNRKGAVRAIDAELEKR